jgi:pyruvate,water dikinase
MNEGSRYVRQLSAIRLQDVPQVGGKAASLGELISLGVAVPSGFCITVSAYESFVKSTGLDEILGGDPKLLDVDDDAQLDQHTGRIRSLFRAEAVPAVVAKELARAYETLGTEAVAVRSSATTEDLAEASFAGQHETYLNVRDAAALLEALVGCWASLWKPRAVRYRVHNGFSVDGAGMAVVVQKMISPRAAGVLYTADPISGERGRLVISSSYGLGEAVVSGQVTPDTFHVRKEGQEIVVRAISRKASKSVAAVGGGTKEQAVERGEADAPSISDEEVIEVAKLGVKVEDHYGSPLDIEWGIDSDGVHLLQARPLTALPDPPEEDLWENPVPGARWRRNWRVGEWLSDPVTPLFSTLLLPVLVAGREEQGFNHLGWDLPKTFEMARPWYCIVNGFFFTRSDPPFRGEAPNTDLAARAAILTERKPAYLLWQEKHLSAWLKRLETFRKVDLAAAKWNEILSLIDEVAMDAGEFWYLQAPIGYGFEEMFFHGFYEERFDEQQRPHYTAFFSGYDSLALKGQRMLYGLAQQARTRPHIRKLIQEESPADVLASLPTMDGGEQVLSGLREYWRDYGHQIFSFDWHFPTLGEQPELTISLLRSYLDPEVPDPAVMLARKRRDREQAMAYIDGATSEWTSEDVDAFRGLLEWHQLCAGIREDIAFHQQKLWPIMRAAVAEFGKRLAGDGRLPSADLVSFLHKEELVDASGSPASTVPVHDLSSVALARQAEWEQRRALSPPDRIPPSTDPSWGEGVGLRIRDYGAHDGEEGRYLTGHGASPGKVTARARVVDDPSDFGLFQRGEILVTISAGPGWTPLFSLASAVVTEVGGGASHSSMVAREYGIPAVMGTGVATREIETGQTITVDGTLGTVHLG